MSEPKAYKDGGTYVVRMNREGSPFYWEACADDQAQVELICEEARILLGRDALLDQASRVLRTLDRALELAGHIAGGDALMEARDILVDMVGLATEPADDEIETVTEVHDERATVPADRQ